MWLEAASGRSAISKQAPVTLIAECALLRRRRTAEPAVTTVRWIWTVCDRRALCPLPGCYAEPRNVQNQLAHPWSWAIGSSTSAAQRPFDMVVCRRKARPFASIAELGLQENGRPSPRERRCGQGLLRWAEEPRAARLHKGASDVRRLEHFRFVQRVTQHSVSTT
jgi:hypothetical protein